MDQIDDKLDRLANVIQALSIQVGRTQRNPAPWPWITTSFICALSTVGFVYLGGKIETRRQADVETAKRLRDLSERLSMFMNMGPIHQERMKEYWKAQYKKNREEIEKQ